MAFRSQDLGPWCRILYQVVSLSLPLLFGLVGIYPVPLPAGNFSAFFRGSGAGTLGVPLGGTRRVGVVSFDVQKLLRLIRSHLFIFAFISNILGGGS